MRPRPAVLLSLALSAVVVALYAPVRDHGFLLFDDPTYVTANPYVRAGPTPGTVLWAFTTFHGANWFPLTWLSHAVDWSLFGERAAGHHAVNVLLHALNAALLYLWLRRATGRGAAAFFVAAVFALHPLRVESVAWISERKDVLSGALFLFALLAWDAWVRRPARRRYALAVALAGLGLMAKPMLVSLPLLLLVLDGWPYGRLGPGGAAGRRRVVEKWPFFVLALGSATTTWLAGRAGGATVSWAASSAGQRLANALVSWMAYLGDLLWPTRLAPFYPFDPPTPTWRWAGALALLVALSWLAWSRRRDAPWGLAGWLWYLVALLPVIGLVQIGAHARADRFTYLPGIGIAWIVVWGVDRLAARLGARRLAATAGVLALVALAVAARQQLAYWRDDVTLFRRTLEVTRDNPVARFNLANGLRHVEPASAARWTEAERCYREALRGRPLFAEAHFNLANLLSDTGREREALEHYRAAVQARPADARLRNSLGVTLARLGREEEARQQFSEAVRIDPAYEDARRNLAVAVEGPP